MCLATERRHTRTLLRVHGLALRGANRAPAELHLAHPCIRVPCRGFSLTLGTCCTGPHLTGGGSPCDASFSPSALTRRVRARVAFSEGCAFEGARGFVLHRMVGYRNGKAPAA